MWVGMAGRAWCGEGWEGRSVIKITVRFHSASPQVFSCRVTCSITPDELLQNIPEGSKRTQYWRDSVIHLGHMPCCWPGKQGWAEVKLEGEAVGRPYST